MIVKKNSQSTELTREKALEFVNMEALPGERAIRLARMKFLRKHVELGTFYGPDWDLAIDLSTGKKYRANGQHSSKMLAELPENSFPVGLLVTITTWEIGSVQEDGRTLFNKFDHPSSTRTNLDVMGVDKAFHPDLAKIPSQRLMRAANGIHFTYVQANKELLKLKKKAKLAEKEFRAPYTKYPIFPNRKFGDYLAESENREFAIWLDLMMDTPDQLHSFIFSITGVLSAMYTDWKKDPDAASEFWEDVATGKSQEDDGVTKELATLLRKWYKEAKKTQEQYNKEAKKMSNWYFRAKKQEGNKPTDFVPAVIEQQPHLGA